VIVHRIPLSYLLLPEDKTHLRRAGRAKQLFSAALMSGAHGSWFPVHGPRQDGGVTPGLVLK
jgi:hypothetical protein